MSDPCVIRADYANWRPVAGRKVLQLILEVPLEQTADVMEKLGVPMPGESKWVAVALLESGKPANESEDGALKSALKPSEGIDAPETQAGSAPSHTTAITAAAGTSEIRNKERRPFDSLPLSSQAAILCQDGNFRNWLKDAYHDSAIDGPDAAANVVRRACGVQSRADLNIIPDAAQAWGAIVTSYRASETDRQYADVRR